MSKITCDSKVVWNAFQNLYSGDPAQTLIIHNGDDRCEISADFIEWLTEKYRWSMPEDDETIYDFLEKFSEKNPSMSTLLLPYTRAEIESDSFRSVSTGDYIECDTIHIYI